MPSFLDPVIPISPIAPRTKAGPIGGASPPAGVVLSGTGKLHFTMQKQENGEWCWAAVSSSVAAYFGSTQWTQCAIASSELNLSCCGQSMPASCNVPWSMDTALSLVGHFVAFFTGPSSFAQVQQEISKGNPVGIRIVWSGNSGAHFIAVAGWLVDPQGTQFLDVFDPFYGDGPVEFSDLSGGYRAHGDLWSHTYLTNRFMIAAGGSPSIGFSPISA